MKRNALYLLAIAALVAVLALPTAALADTATNAGVVQAGGTTTLVFDVVNETSAEQSYTLSATGLPAGSSASFTQDGTVTAAISIAGDSDSTVTMQVAVPAEATLGRYDGTFTATRADGAAVSAPFVLSVQNTYALKITSTATSISAFSGKDFTLDIAATNAGATAVTGVTPVMDMPSKWVLLSDPPRVPSLDPGAEAVFHLTVTVPASQVAIDQPVSVSVSSDQASSPAADVSVRVQSNPVFLPIAGGVVLIALIAVIVYFRLKGRR